MAPWCPFCGSKIDRPKPPTHRKLGEFDMGECKCGAVYTCDPTGHNVGSAMVDTLVYACNDDWDLAWELTPEEDYLTGRIENYDEVSHQVLDQKHMDGRYVRGVLFFVRLHKDIKEITARIEAQKTGEQSEAEAETDYIPEIEPERDPKRKKHRATKPLVRQLVATEDIDGLVDLVFDDIKTLRFLQRLLYDPDEDFHWRTVYMTGAACARLSTRQPGPVSDLLHRLFEACSDSAASSWGIVETIGAIVAARPDIFGAFTRHLLKYVDHPTTRKEALWALGTIAENRPDLIRNTPFYQLFSFLDDPDPMIKALMLRLLGRIKATEALEKIKIYADDTSEITFYENGKPINTTITALAQEAIDQIQKEVKASD